MNEQEILNKLFQEFGEGTEGYQSLDEAIADINKSIERTREGAYEEGFDAGFHWNTYYTE